MPDYVISIASPISVEDHVLEDVTCSIGRDFVVFYKGKDVYHLFKAFPAHAVLHLRMKGETNENPD